MIIIDLLASLILLQPFLIKINITSRKIFASQSKFTWVNLIDLKTMALKKNGIFSGEEIDFRTYLVGCCENVVRIDLQTNNFSSKYLYISIRIFLKEKNCRF